MSPSTEFVLLHEAFVKSQNNGQSCPQDALVSVALQTPSPHVDAKQSLKQLWEFSFPLHTLSPQTETICATLKLTLCELVIAFPAASLQRTYLV